MAIAAHFLCVCVLFLMQQKDNNCLSRAEHQQFEGEGQGWPQFLLELRGNEGDIIIIILFISNPIFSITKLQQKFEKEKLNLRFIGVFY